MRRGEVLPTRKRERSGILCRCHFVENMYVVPAHLISDGKGSVIPRTILEGIEARDVRICAPASAYSESEKTRRVHDWTWTRTFCLERRPWTAEGVSGARCSQIRDASSRRIPSVNERPIVKDP